MKESEGRGGREDGEVRRQRKGEEKKKRRNTNDIDQIIIILNVLKDGVALRTRLIQRTPRTLPQRVRLLFPNVREDVGIDDGGLFDFGGGPDSPRDGSDFGDVAVKFALHVGRRDEKEREEKGGGGRGRGRGSRRR